MKIYGLFGLSRWFIDRESAGQAGDVGSIPGSEDPVEEEMTTHSSILAWEVPRTEKPGGLQSVGSQVGHDLETEQQQN